MIQLKHLTKRFGGGEDEVRALEDVSIAIQPGEIFGVIGLSGAGKSTLVRCVNLLERPTEGEVIVDGQDMTRLSDRELREARKSIGMIFQSFNLLMQRTALDNICFPLELVKVPRREAEARARELLEIVDLAGKANAYPAQLSGGQKQRVAIARTLANNPKVLLCDEATSALDPKTTRDILRLIQDINKRLGITVVVITHEMKVIEEICSRVAILDHGHLAETGTVEEVFANPKSEAGRRLVYPDGVPLEVYSAAADKARVVRVAFNGGTSYQPLIATLAIECGVKANILGADTRNIDGRAFGTMLLGLPEDGAEKALAYIRAQRDITVEEVPDYHG
ncbi:MAG: ATP-binding cassette domain-containing protein [Oscillospiraceae bacterium]|nr:ATP-binding cassette domain-containing protein [Oscillospiraceae bacterium]